MERQVRQLEEENLNSTIAFIPQAFATEAPNNYLQLIPNKKQIRINHPDFEFLVYIFEQKSEVSQPLFQNVLSFFVFYHVLDQVTHVVDAKPDARAAVEQVERVIRSKVEV